MNSPIRTHLTGVIFALAGALSINTAQSGPGSLFSAGSNHPRSIASEPVSGSNATYTVIARGLHSPRGLTFAGSGRLYVAEAGIGGTAENPFSYTGAIDEIVNPEGASSLRRVVYGLASVGDRSLGEIVGLGGLAADRNGGISAIIGESLDATGNSGFGQLLSITTSGGVEVKANVGSVDYLFTYRHADLDPGGQYPDANPYGVLNLPDHTYVVDAGSNTLDEVFPNGKVKVLAYFENNITADSTPTCLAQGPDGAIYVGVLALVDSLVFGPSAKIYRVDPATLPPGVIVGQAYEWATGLWPINGCAFGPDGTFYASELITSSDFSGGDVVKIPFDDPATHISLTDQTLPLAAGVAVGDDGTVYAVGLTAYDPNGFVARLKER